MQLTPTQAQHAFVPLMALTMSGLISLFMTAFNVGLHAGLPQLWLQNWLVGFAVALPTALLVVPLIRNGLARVTVHSSVHPSPGHEAVARAPGRLWPKATPHPLSRNAGEGGTDGGAVGGERATS